MKNYYGLDWDEIWNEVNGANIRCEAFGECASIWQSKEEARCFLNNSFVNPERTRFIIDSLPLSSDMKVLDIGSGPGTIAVPVAGQVNHVTAVEPSPGMADVMEEYAAERGVSNLDIVRKRWEEIELSSDLSGPYDLVLASYSLGMQDLSSTIEMMNDASSRWVYIFWISGMPSWEQGLAELWPRLHEKEFCYTPQADIIYNTLYSIGIYPNTRVMDVQSRNHFPDMDSAVSRLSSTYNIKTAGQEEILRRYLNEKLVRTEDGYESLESNKATAFWWEVSK